MLVLSTLERGVIGVRYDIFKTENNNIKVEKLAQYFLLRRRNMEQSTNQPGEARGNTEQDRHYHGHRQGNDILE